MSQKTYLNILKSGIYLTLVSVFLVFQSFLFPYISSKQIFFNIVIEILLVFWLALVVKYPEYRPKKSYITHGLIAFCAAIFLSSIFGVDFNLSFWGDVERLLGVFHVLHFFAFYLIIITVFREWRDWKVLFIISVVFAMFVSLKGLTGKPFSTIGNTAYVSGYLIFNLYFAVILFFREPNKILRWLYLIPAPIMLLAFKGAHTRGAHIGLGFSIILFFFLYGLFCKSKKIKQYALVIGLILVLATTFLFINKDSDWVRNNSALKIVSSISWQKNTFQTRLIAWRAALKDFKNHPFLGTGYGNFAIIFDKYFEASFFSYTSSETYFDRAHNNIVDITSTSGLIGLLAYLSIFVAAAYYLIQGYRKNKITLLEFSLVSCLIIAYFIQNLVVFDSLVTYMGIMITLAYVYWLHEKGEEGITEKLADKSRKTIERFTRDKKVGNTEAYILVIAGLVSLFTIYQYSVKPIQMLVGSIEGYGLLMSGQPERGYEVFKQALSLNTPLDRDARAMFARVVAFEPQKLNGLSKDKKQEILDYGIELAEKNVAYNPEDTLSQLLLSQMFVTTADANKDNSEKFDFYINQALDTADKTIASSPERMPNYYHKAQILFAQGRLEDAFETLRYAVSLNRDYAESYCTLAKTLIYYDRDEEGYENMDKCLDLGGVNFLNSDMTRVVAGHYVEAEDWDRIEKLLINLTRLEPNNLENWVNLIKLYGRLGDKEKAQAAVDKAAEIDYTIKASAQEFIDSIPDN